MLYPITLWLWTFLFASPDAAPLSAQLQNPFVSPIVLGDSTIYQELKEKLANRQKAIAPEKLYLQLDRTLYVPGDDVWFNAYVRNAGDLQASLQSQILYVELLDPRGSMLEQKTFLALDGTTAGDFQIKAEWPGGLYKIKAYTRWMENTGDVFERTLTVQKVVLPNLNMKLEFERKALGPGDMAIARLDVSGLDNKALAKSDIRFTATADGRECAVGTAKTDGNGRAYLKFRLPEDLKSADGLLNVLIAHKGSTESISRAIPIVLNKIDLQFFPEGGDAVAGLPCQMAFKALNEFGKPADVSGIIVDEKGAQVAEFSSYHDGMGAFGFVPQAGRRYEARLTRPLASDTPYPLPDIAVSGYSLRLQNRNEKSLQFAVSATGNGKAYLLGTSQDKPFFFREIEFGGQSSDQQVTVPVQDLPMGIARFTLFDSEKSEQAERLVFVNRDKGLDIEITTDKERYLPREKVQMDIKVRDHMGRPVQGRFSLAVADEKLLSFADDKQGHILASLLLEQDVKGKIEEPNFYFDPAEPKSAQALDYLLMTQGWRRFEWEEVLEDQPVAYDQPAERASIAGVLVKRNGKPLPWATVSLYPNGPKTETDNEGRFTFTNVDIEQYTHVQYWRDQYSRIYWYDENMKLAPSGAVTQATVRYQNGKNGSTFLQGKVTDDQGETMIGATVKIMKGSDFVRGTITDFDGNYRVAPLEPGTYDVVFSYTGYAEQRVKGVKTLMNQIAFLDATMCSTTVISDVEVTAFKTPAIEKDKTAGGQTLTSQQIKNLPTRSVNATVTASEEDAGITIRGSRADATTLYIDGIRAQAKKDMEADEMLDLAGGVPADLPNAMEINEVQVVAFKVPLIEQDKTSTGQILDAGQLRPRSSASFSKKRLAAAERNARMQARPLKVFARARTFYTPAYESSTPATATRTDFRSTIFWKPDITTDRKGRASVEFYTSDAITNFRATLEGIGTKGQAGRAEKKFFVQKPLSMAVKMPASVISGDLLRLQVMLTNHTSHIAGGHLDLVVPEHFTLKNEPELQIQIAPGATKTINIEYQIGSTDDSAEKAVSIRFSADENVLDASETGIRTLDRGFPARQIASGSAAQNKFNFHLQDPVEGSISAMLTAYPNALEDVLKGMERMLRQPCGCFEQVSSSNYPNLLVLDLLRQTGTARPDVERKAATLLEDGYKRLTAYECKSGGFDWWGRDPAHEGLTAYGILEFTDMSKVFEVDQKLIERSVNWLYGRRDGKGSWKRRNDQHGWQSDGVVDAYIAWALAEAGYGKKFASEIDYAYTQAIQSKDPYQVALMANAMLVLKDKRSTTLLEMLRGEQSEDGSWTGSTHSVMYAQGKCFQIETTALSALALMKSGKDNVALNKAMDFLVKSKTEYGYGSTQSTVLALKALVEYARIGNNTPADGTLVVQIDGKKVAEQSFSSKDPKRLEIAHLERFFGSGDPQIEVYFENPKMAIPFDLEIKYASRLPRNVPGCPLGFTTQLDKSSASVGETVRLSATLENPTGNVQSSPMIVLGIPAGLTLQPWQLKKLVEEKKCDFYELWDGFAVFHFEQLAPNERRVLNLDLRADIAGNFEAPASQAFLYYSNDQRVWSKPERLSIVP
ncbi:MAG: carboxypeptidase regulatory-like domain-containing protein [Lewinellaceae bacterium]|nr:carboxypeptidase regulatory-like domain-containing protein [Lewinellaceae bacterium]